ncbi:hypothetical protein LMH87_000471 [Akanthomyces muscarius]|uniref:Uncharacterized protein n=1 Tax=Akanthomyces muscarius TaxID=2231603 RepID=A0A9W8QF29_AKAMU|nr:hypothetical protein LMH87_000471 [Akanthomyces muscarius]KAJ4155215.1 hypothetical protein LMH87_000471 [Akanthomyces muscarius]
MLQLAGPRAEAAPRAPAHPQQPDAAPPRAGRRLAAVSHRQRWRSRSRRRRDQPAAPGPGVRPDLRGRPRHELRQRIFALARACQKTCREHRARAEAIYLRVRRRWDEDQRARGRAAAAARRHGAGGGGGRGIRVKFRRGNVALNYAQRDLDRARLAHMSFDELCEALRGRTLEEREALDQITQPGGEIRILRERFDPEAAVGQVVTGLHELCL